MLCVECVNIVLDPRRSDVHTEIRAYNGLSSLRSTTSSCDFCRLIYEEVQHLNQPTWAPYCHSKWGSDVYEEAVERGPIKVHHIAAQGDHNILIEGSLDAQSLPGYYQGPGNLTWGVKLGGICTQPDSTLASLISGRLYNANSSKTHLSILAGTWLNNCRETHALCMKRNVSYIPKRVIRVDLDDPMAKPRLLCMTQGLSGAYATLSYCWGKDESALLTSKNMDSFCTLGIPAMPISCQEAYELCRFLRLQYLWVDRMCILQDSDEDWLEQSSVIGQIYSAAELTIKASSGPSCRAGIFSDRVWHSKATATLQCLDSQLKTQFCTVRGRLCDRDRDREPLDCRGWALQEDILSARIISFGTAEMIWECRETCANESRKRFDIPNGAGSIFPRPLRQILKHDQAGDRSSNIDDELVARTWRKIVQDYCARSLSLPKDKLPALSGIAWWIADYGWQAKQGLYLAGLWEGQLPRNLLWYYKLPLHTNTTVDPTRYRAPSWSWASLDSPYLQWVDSEVGEERSEVISVAVRGRTSDPFGEVLDGHLSIRGSLRQLSLVPSKWWVERYELCSMHDVSQGREGKMFEKPNPFGNVYLDTYESSHESGVVRNLAVTARQLDCLRITKYCGMLIERVNNSSTEGFPALWKRIGIVTFQEETVEAMWSESNEATIRLE